MTADSSMKRALAALQRAERDSRLLRALGAPRQLLVDDGLAVADPSLVDQLPFEPRSWTPLPVPGLAPVRAGAVLVGRSDNYLRLRAFYLDARLTIAIHHGWPPRVMSSSLHRGAGMRHRLLVDRSDGRLVMPRPLEEGRALLGAWLVEELLPGRPVGEEDWPELAPLVGAEMIGASLASGAAERPLHEVLSSAALRAAIDEIERQPDPGIDVRTLVARVTKLALSGGPVLVGPTHGDPGRRNVLRLQQGRLGLVDWEAARVRIVAHDLVKAIEELDDPLAAAGTISSSLAGAGGNSSGGWYSQAAVASLVRVAASRRWLGRSSVARLRGRSSVSGRAARNRQRTIRLLDQLLEASE